MNKKIDYKNDTKIKWEKEINQNVMLYPNEKIVAFAAKNYNGDNTEKKVLDIGFGSGRNLIPFLNKGFECYGIDYNLECCNVAKKVLKDYKNLKEVFVGDVMTTEFEKASFDAIILYGVLFLNDLKDMNLILEKINYLLKIGGKCIVNFRTKEDSLYKNWIDEKIDENTYIISEKNLVYGGSSYCFLDLEEATEMILKNKFKIIDIQREDFWKNNLKEQHSWYIFSIEKTTKEV